MNIWQCNGNKAYVPSCWWCELCNNMKVGIIGSGVVGTTLALGFQKHGHEVTIGSRNPAKLDSWAKKNHFKGHLTSVADAIAAGADLVVLAVLGDAAESVVREHKDAMAHKIVMDTCNPISPDTPPVHGVLSLFTSPNESLMERLQKIADQARFVKAFSCIGAPFMINPAFKHRPTMFICGNDAHAKSVVGDVCSQFGFDVEDSGAVESARAIEPLVMLWCQKGLATGQWDAKGFALVRP